MRGAGMAAAYVAGVGLLGWVAFQAGAWMAGCAFGVWCRVKDNRQEKAA